MLQLNLANNKRLIPALCFAALLTGCTVHTGYRAYDPGYKDYHTWSPAESGYYNQWAVETHKPKRDYKRLNHSDQQEYWKWRHEHPDHH
jgi:hypothetical protein